MQAILQGVNRLADTTITILDENGNPVSGATVDIVWSGVITGSDSGTTDSIGETIIMSSKTKTSGTLTITVSDVSASGYTYNPSLNTETSDSIDI